MIRWGGVGKSEHQNWLAIGQINNFIDKDHRVSAETVSARASAEKFPG